MNLKPTPSRVTSAPKYLAVDDPMPPCDGVPKPGAPVVGPRTQPIRLPPVPIGLVPPVPAGLVPPVPAVPLLSVPPVPVGVPGVGPQAASSSPAKVATTARIPVGARETRCKSDLRLSALRDRRIY